MHLVMIGDIGPIDDMIHIGDEAMIGQYCIIGDSDEPEPVAGAVTPSAVFPEPRPVVIGAGAWLAGAPAGPRRFCRRTERPHRGF